LVVFVKKVTHQRPLLADHMLVSEIEREQRLKRNFLLFGSTLLTGGSNQKYCMLSRFVNLYDNTESAIPPGGGFPFSFLLPLSCAARGLPLGLLTLVSSKTLGSLAYLEHSILSSTRDFSTTYFSCSRLQEHWACSAHTEPGNPGSFV
jgi:hypothetical protein